MESRVVAARGSFLGFARVGGDIPGIVELEAGEHGDVGIVVSGLQPRVHRAGTRRVVPYDGQTQLAWTEMWLASNPTTRIWVQMSSRDHPHALPNYERRGFRPTGMSAAPHRAGVDRLTGDKVDDPVLHEDHSMGVSLAQMASNVFALESLLDHIVALGSGRHLDAIARLAVDLDRHRHAI
jgi:hypothetical protein